MHFDKVVTDRISIPKIDVKIQKDMVQQLSRKIELKSELEKLR